MRASPIFVFTAIALTVLLAATADAIEAVGALESLRQQHPRLLLTAERLTDLKSASETEPVLARYVADAIAKADETISAAPLQHRLVGPRLLSVSRDCLSRVYALALAWRWTGDERYARAAEANLLTAAAFPDWNPPHFLDTAEMSHAVAVGYDWLFDTLSDESKAVLRKALIEKGLKPGLTIYEKGGWWTESEFNWNQVCNGGMLIGALAIAETDPEYAQRIIPYAVQSLPKALHAYDPDGAWMEGPAYWHYATRYTAYGLCALDTALGKDYGLSESPGLRATGWFPIYTAGPTGRFLNYADSGENSARKPMACMFWLARKYGDLGISDDEHAVVAETEMATPEHVIWYVPPTGQPAAARELDRHIKSPVDIVVMRSAWNDPNALFVGVKGGYNQVNHGHLDLGNFELDALGMRWARDLGKDDYNLPGYWDKKKGGKRWNYYRLNAQSHNVPLLSGKDQDADAVARILEFVSSADEARVAIDLTSAYPGLAAAAKRDVALINKRRAVVVRDRFELTAPCEVLWGMTTDAAIRLGEAGSATLSLEGRELIARVLEPSGAAFSVESAERPDPENRNEGVNRLVVRHPDARGSFTVAVLLAPVWDDGAVTAPDMTALPK